MPPMTTPPRPPTAPDHDHDLVPNGLDLHDVTWDELAPRRAYELLRLRVDTFVVEQDCAYPELDGRDLEDGARHLLLTDRATDRVATALRLLHDRVDGRPVRRIGRVVTAPDHRGRGLARRLLAHVLAEVDVPVVLDAQSHLQDWYAASGFRVTGPGWLEDGIPHVPMRRDPDGDGG